MQWWKKSLGQLKTFNTHRAYIFLHLISPKTEHQYNYKGLNHLRFSRNPLS